MASVVLQGFGHPGGDDGGRTWWSPNGFRFREETLGPARFRSRCVPLECPIATKTFTGTSGRTSMERASLDVDTLLKVILLLIAVLLALEVADRFFDALFGVFRPIVSLLIILLIVLWLLDRI
jgi:hypothetical protein